MNTEEILTLIIQRRVQVIELLADKYTLLVTREKSTSGQWSLGAVGGPVTVTVRPCGKTMLLSSGQSSSESVRSCKTSTVSTD